ncbi:MAG: hypothetical protein ACR2JE_18275 [Acidobacteriaceae bacterium]
MDDSKEKLAAQVFDSIGDMVRGYAQEAVRVAQKQFGVRLDFTPHSIAALEGLLEGQAAADLDFQSRLWGSYLGEVMRFRWNGEWLLAQYPGGQAAVPTLEVSGSRLYPTMKIYRRLTLGAAESVLTFCQMVASRLDAPPAIPGPAIPAPRSSHAETLAAGKPAEREDAETGREEE